MTLELASTRSLVERTIGRPLRQAEQAIDILKLDAALRHAKDRIEQEIRTEQRRAARRWTHLDQQPRLRLTRRMIRPLEDLYGLGQREALLELERLGIRVPARTFEGLREGFDPLQRLVNLIQAALRRQTLKVHNQLVEFEATDMAAAALARALFDLSGGRDIASQIVSSALYAGLGATFEQNQGLVAEWEITALLDSGTCDPCAEHDGEVFDSWAAISELLPDGGPAVYCDGGGRCRCRALPRAA